MPILPIFALLVVLVGVSGIIPGPVPVWISGLVAGWVFMILIDVQAGIRPRVDPGSPAFAALQDDYNWRGLKIVEMVEIAGREMCRAEKAEARVTELEEKISWAVDALQEINPSNYDHDDVCALNASSVEVALSLQYAIAPADQGPAK